MKDKNFGTYHIAKTISYEILIQELLQLQSEATSRILNKYHKKKISLKMKFLSYKVINALIFAILPIFPVISYLELTQSLIASGTHIQILLFLQNLNLQMFFLLQLFDFFLMGVFNFINIMAGEIFEWMKTLPLSRAKLKKVILFTIFHNFDLPIVTNICAFPIILLILTQNFFIFLVSLGCSILNMIFSLALLIIFSEKIAKIMKNQGTKARKSLIVQFFNVFSYVIIIFGSILVIQIIMGLLVPIVRNFADLRFSPFYNIVLCLIPYPFCPSYLISFLVTNPQMQINFWLSPLFGLGLYLIVIYLLSSKSMESLSKLISLKFKKVKFKEKPKEDIFKVDPLSPVKAFIRKDLVIASRNLEEFLYFLMPIVISFVFMIFFNISYATNGVLFSGDLYFTWMVLIGFGPIISGMIIYNVLNMELSGKAIMDTLPVHYRDQAKAKMMISILIEIIATIGPALVYTLHSRFMEFFLVLLGTLPFGLFFLILNFILRVRLFGRKLYAYVLEEIFPENKTMKWGLIFFVDYAVYILLITLSSFFYFYYSFLFFFVVLSITITGLMILLTFIFNKYFPRLKALRTKRNKKPIEVKLRKKVIVRQDYAKSKSSSIILLIALSTTLLIYIIIAFFLLNDLFYVHSFPPQAVLQMVIGSLLIFIAIMICENVVLSPKRASKRATYVVLKEKQFIDKPQISIAASSHLKIDEQGKKSNRKKNLTWMRNHSFLIIIDRLIINTVLLIIWYNFGIRIFYIPGFSFFFNILSIITGAFGLFILNLLFIF